MMVLGAVSRVMTVAMMTPMPMPARRGGIDALVRRRTGMDRRGRRWSGRRPDQRWLGWCRRHRRRSDRGRGRARTRSGCGRMLRRRCGQRHRRNSARGDSGAARMRHQPPAERQGHHGKQCQYRHGDTLGGPALARGGLRRHLGLLQQAQRTRSGRRLGFRQCLDRRPHGRCRRRGGRRRRLGLRGRQALGRRRRRGPIGCDGDDRGWWRHRSGRLPIR